MYRRIILAWPWPEEQLILVESNTVGFLLYLCVLAIRYTHYKFTSRAVGATRAHHGLCRVVSSRSSSPHGATLLSPLACTHTLSLNGREDNHSHILSPVHSCACTHLGSVARFLSLFLPSKLMLGSSVPRFTMILHRETEGRRVSSKGENME